MAYPLNFYAFGVPLRIGVFGGTFDPPHRGHLAVAEAARDRLGLDKVLLVVAGDPWQKSPNRVVSPAVDRLAMVTALVHGADGRTLPGLDVSDIEIRRGGPSYTVTTLRELAIIEPGAEFFLIIGRDLVEGFPTWHEASEIERLATIVVADRPGHAASLRPGWRSLEIDAIDVSSSDLRERLQAGRDVLGDVPAAVIAEIGSRGLYGARSGQGTPTVDAGRRS